MQPKSSKVRMAPRQLPGSNPGVVLNLPSEMLIAAVPFVSVLVWFQSSAQEKAMLTYVFTAEGGTMKLSPHNSSLPQNGGTHAEPKLARRSGSFL